MKNRRSMKDCVEQFRKGFDNTYTEVDIMTEFGEMILQKINERCDYLVSEYFKRRKTCVSFELKNIYNEGEIALTTLKRDVNLMFKKAPK